MLSCLKKAIFGDAGGLEKSEIDIKRDRFSSLFPWVSYDEDTKHYYLRDNSAGWIWECSPLLFADDNAFKSISSLLKTSDLPHNTTFQFMLYADPYIQDIIHGYESLRRNNSGISDLYNEVTHNYAEFLMNGLKGMWQLSGTPLRNYRLFISVKLPISADITSNPEKYIKEVNKHKDFISSIKDTLKILSPRPLMPESLITFMYRLTNPDLSPDKELTWDDNIPIHKQIIYADTEIERQKTSIRFGSKYVGTITPKKLPRTIDNMFSNDMIGFISKGITAIENDINQIQCPYIYTVNIVTDKNLKTKLTAKAIHNSRIAKGSAKDDNSDGMAVSTGNRREENIWVAQQYEEGNTILHVIPQVTLIANSEEELVAKQNRTKSFWNTLGVESQTELKYFLHVLFVAGLPCGFYHQNLQDLERSNPMETSGAAMFTPIQASFKGIGEPVMLYLDRRGQLVHLDIFKTGSNKNFYVTGGTGKGKSFFMNSMVNAYRSIGAKFRIITVCDSYKKTTYLTDGQYIEHEEENMVLNFFAEAGTMKGTLTENIKVDGIEFSVGQVVEIAEISDVYCKIVHKIGDLEYLYIIPYQEFENIHFVMDGDTLNMLTGILASMVTSRSSTLLDEDELTILESAVSDTFKFKNRDMDIDDVYNYLMTIEEFLKDDERSRHYINTAHNLAKRLEKYTSRGPYGKYFNGKSTVSFKKDIVVVDLTKTPHDLRKVFVLAFANLIEQEVYKGDRKTPTFVGLDESWQTLSENPYAGRFVNGLYRKIRKYNGSVFIVTQSLMDLHETGVLGSLGDVIRTQSDFSFNLFDKNFANAYENRILDISPFEYETLIAKIPEDSLPRYSEIFVRTPHGNTVVRLIVDEYMYFMNTSAPEDYVFIREQAQKYLELGYSTAVAMKEAVQYCAELSKKLGGIGEFKKYLSNNMTA